MTEAGRTMASLPEGPGTLMAELHFEQQPTLDLRQLEVDVQTTLPQTDLVDSPGAEVPAVLSHGAFITDFVDRKGVPILTAVLRGKEKAGDSHASIDLSQTPSRAAIEGLQACRHELLIAEVAGRARPAPERVTAFRTVLLAVVKQCRPLAVWWPTSRLLTEPPAPESPVLKGLVNVRFFGIPGRRKDAFMDTLGMYALHLPDIQCHFRGLEPDQVGALLANAANYIFEEGDVIEDGHTIESVCPGQRWLCQHQDSLVTPPRIVLNVDPGPEHAGRLAPTSDKSR